MWTMNFQMFKLLLEKAEEPEIKLPTFTRSSKKQESFRKTTTSVLLTIAKPLTLWLTTNCGKFFKWWEYQSTLPASWEICIQVKKQQLELDLEQWNGPDWERSMSRLYIVCLFNFYADSVSQSVQSLSCVRLFVTPWTTVCQASRSTANSQSLLQLMCTESVMPSNSSRSPNSGCL